MFVSSFIVARSMVIHASDLSRANVCASLIFLAKRSLSIAQWYTSRSVTHPGVVAAVAGVGQHAVQFDDPADEIRVRLLPEWFFPLAEKLIQK